MSHKKIIIFNKIGINQEIYQNLKHLNYDVYCYINNDINFKPNLIDIVKNIFYKVVLKDKRYFIKKQKDFFNLFNKNQLLDQPHFDFGLLIRADKYEDDILSIIRHKTTKLIGYQWDGLNRYPNIYNKIHFFNKFYCFDVKYCSGPVEFTTNFYFDYKEYPKMAIEYDIIYIGFYTEERYKFLLQFYKYIKNKKVMFQLMPQTKKEKNQIRSNSKIQTLEKVYSYQQMMELNNKARIFIDLKVPDHDGLSFRFFEAIQLNKKIITNNKSVMNYDFYNKDYIFILELDKNIEEFINANNEVNYSSTIKRKYSFSNWINEKLYN